MIAQEKLWLSQMLQTKLYTDDLCSGFDSSEEGQTLISDLIQVLEKHSFQVFKIAFDSAKTWIQSHKELRQKIIFFIPIERQQKAVL